MVCERYELVRHAIDASDGWRGRAVQMTPKGPRRDVAGISIHAIAARRRASTVHRRSPFARNRAAREIVVNNDRLLWCSTDDIGYHRSMALGIRIWARRPGR